MKSAVYSYRRIVRPTLYHFCLVWRAGRSFIWRMIVAKGATHGWILVERDIPGFYLQAKLADANTEHVNTKNDIQIFMEQFQGFEEVGPDGEELVMEMDG